MPPKNSLPPAVVNDLTAVVSTLSTIITYVNANQPNDPKEIITLPADINGAITKLKATGSRLSMFMKNQGIVQFTPNDIAKLIGPILQITQPNIIMHIQQGLRKIILDIFIILGTNKDISSILIHQYQYLYTIRDVLMVADDAYRGMYWDLLSVLYMNNRHRLCPISCNDLSPFVNKYKISSPPQPTTQRTPQDYAQLWNDLIKTAQNEVVNFFTLQQQEPIPTVVVTPITHSWELITKIISLIISRLDQNTVLYQCVEDKNLSHESTIVTFTTIIDFTSVAILLLQHSITQSETKTTTKTTTDQQNAFVFLLSQLHEIIGKLISPYEDPEEANQNNGMLGNLMNSIETKTTTTNNKKKEPSKHQLELYSNVMSKIIFKSLSPIVMDDLTSLISHEHLQGNAFMMLLQLLEGSYEHLVYFVTGHAVTPWKPIATIAAPQLYSPNQHINDMTQSASTPLSRTLEYTSAMFNKSTHAPKFQQSAMNIDKNRRWLLTDDAVAQYATCLFDLIETVLQQSSTKTPPQSNISVHVRHLLAQFNIIPILTAVAEQVTSELNWVRAKQEFVNATKPKLPQPMLPGKAPSKAIDFEGEWVPAYIIVNRLFYLLGSLFSFSHQTILISAGVDVTTVTSDFITSTDANIIKQSLQAYITDFITTQLVHFPTLLKTLFVLFNPCDAHTSQVHDNNDTCDSLYSAIMHTQLYDLLLQALTSLQNQPQTPDETTINIDNISQIITESMSSILTSLNQVKDTIMPQIDARPIVFDEESATTAHKLVERHMTVLATLDSSIIYDPTQDYTPTDVIAQFITFITNRQNNYNAILDLIKKGVQQPEILSTTTVTDDKTPITTTLIYKYVHLYPKLNEPPTAPLISRAQPIEAYLSNVVNKVAYIDSVMKQKPQSMYEVGFDSDFKGDEPEEHVDDDDEDDDEDDEDDKSATTGENPFSFGGDGGFKF